MPARRWRWPATSAHAAGHAGSKLDAVGLARGLWVVELSSFQLDGVDGFEPTAATVLNVTQDHLDWHGDMDAYAAKAHLWRAGG